MPRFRTFNDDGGVVERYRWPAKYITPVVGIGDALRDWRRIAIKDREKFIEFQRGCGRNDREYARFFKECANHMLRLQRACTLMLPWMGTPDNNQRLERPLLWPLELDGELDEISNRIVLQYG